MIMSKENFLEFVTIVSNDSYGETVYSTKIKNDGYDVVIKSCCNNCIMELVKNGFNMDMGKEGLTVWKW